VSGRRPLGISAMGLVTPIGSTPQAVTRALFAGTRAGLVARDDLHPTRSVKVGVVPDALPQTPDVAAPLDCRNNQLMLAALLQIEAQIMDAARRYGRDRVVIVVGTSTAGVAEHELAHAARRRDGVWRNSGQYRQWEAGTLADYIARAFDLHGPAYTVVTACSASAKVFASARRLIEAGLCDAAIVGGADTLCQMTVAGFSSLEAVSADICNPFSRNRDGITIGEASAAFLLTKDKAPVCLLGAGEGSDAYHVSAPDPEGRGAAEAIKLALSDAGLSAHDIAYVNLHGTGTPHNDVMEGKAVANVLGADARCSSTKAMVGHTLGAAGAVEAAFVWLTLHPEHNPDRLLPVHVWDGVVDPEIPPLDLVRPGMSFAGSAAMLSSSFAFGGNNVVLAFGRG
jgi:3-oxoacyl-[acyl-carrier-protein] synthase I